MVWRAVTRHRDAKPMTVLDVTLLGVSQTPGQLRDRLVPQTHANVIFTKTELDIAGAAQNTFFTRRID